jgi:LysM repeat protein
MELARIFDVGIFRLGLVAFLLLSASCSRLAKSAEDRDPNVKRARDRAAVGDYTGAVESYEVALMKRPKSARIHWEVATIYDQWLTNDLRAIYHYERYLELDPNAKRREYVEQLIGAAKLSYAVSLPDRFSDAVRENERLRKEIDSLRQLLTESRDELARMTSPVPGPSSATASPAPSAAVVGAPKPAAPKVATMESYIVQPGDTLSRIAAKFYNDPNKWDVILEANRSVLKKPENIKVGQTLVIPR